jgi:hypothetical protein
MFGYTKEGDVADRKDLITNRLLTYFRHDR